MSTEEQGDSGAGLEAQRRAIVAECKRRGWQLLEVIEDAGFSAKDLKRPGIQEALRVLKEGDAKALIAAKLDRLSRSMIDFTALMATAQKQVGRSSRWTVRSIRPHRPGRRWRTSLPSSRSSRGG